MKNQKKIIITIGIILFSLFSLYFILRDRKLNFIESTIKEITTFIQRPIKSNKEEYNLIEIEEKKRRIKELEGLLEIKNNLSEYETINVAIINRNVGTWYQTLTIDKGSNDGIEENMAVVTNNGLIGKILNVTNNISTVKLLTMVNDTFQISVKIESGENMIYGLLSGFKNNQFIINGISENRTINENSKVLTTGLDNIFPSGILIGYVDKEEKDNFDLAKTLYVNPSNNFDDINYVAVLKRKDIK